MPYRVNGIGTTIAPIPAEGAVAVAMLWFTFLFIPIIPLGWRLIKGVGRGGQSYLVLKKLSYREARDMLTPKGMWQVIAYGYLINLSFLILFVAVVVGLYWLRGGR